MYEIVAGLFGLIVGSFLTVCIYRLPLRRLEEYDPDSIEEDEEGYEELELTINVPPIPPQLKPQEISISTPPRSFCPHCGEKLKWWHNIPFFSWLLLKGRCGFCKERISARYPVVELISGLSAYFSVALYGVSPTTLVVYLFCCALIVISFIDIDYFIIPNVITYPGVVLGVAVSALQAATGWFERPISQSLVESGVGILGGAGFLLIVAVGYLRVRKREGLGLGDVKLLAMTGAFFGPESAFFTIFIGSLVGSLIGGVGILIGKRSWSHALPFGPYLAIGTLIYILALAPTTSPFYMPSIFDAWRHY